MPIQDAAAWPKLPICCRCGAHSWSMLCVKGQWYCFKHFIDAIRAPDKLEEPHDDPG